MTLHLDERRLLTVQKVVISLSSIVYCKVTDGYDSYTARRTRNPVQWTVDLPSSLGVQSFVSHREIASLERSYATYLEEIDRLNTFIQL
jgi:hypothetical protein